IGVGSVDAQPAPTRSLSYFSSVGPTRDKRSKPEVSAPGHRVWAAWSRTGTKVTQKSGTSMASPAITGLVALLLADARSRNMNLDIAAIRQRLLAGVLRTPPGGTEWDPRYGFGRATVVTAAPPGAPPPPPPDRSDRGSPAATGA